MTKKKSHSSLFSTVSGFSYTGNIIWGVLFGLLLIGCIINGASMLEETSLDNFFGGVVVGFAFMSTVILALCVVCIIGLVKMKKGERRGFLIYAISNGLWSLILIYSSQGDFLFLGMAAVSIAFIIYYAIFSKQLN